MNSRNLDLLNCLLSLNVGKRFPHDNDGSETGHRTKDPLLLCQFERT